VECEDNKKGGPFQKGKNKKAKREIGKDIKQKKNPKRLWRGKRVLSI
jgi:hypothetical protein